MVRDGADTRGVAMPPTAAAVRSWALTRSRQRIGFCRQHMSPPSVEHRGHHRRHSYKWQVVSRVGCPIYCVQRPRQISHIQHYNDSIPPSSTMGGIPRGLRLHNSVLSPGHGEGLIKKVNVGWTLSAWGGHTVATTGWSDLDIERLRG